MTTILISIKPKYVDLILSGKKKYEYRKTFPKKNDINKMIIYCTSPVKKVVAEIEVLDVLYDNKEDIWNSTCNYSGVSKESYDNYFKNSEKSVAFKLGKIYEYNQSPDLSDFSLSFPPQSYIYVNDYDA